MTLSGSHLAGLMRGVLEKNACFRFRARGYSMTPFIRDGDVVCVYPAEGRTIGPGDVVAAADPSTGRVIVHRVIIRFQEGGISSFVIKGDNCRAPDGRFDAGRMIGVIGRVERAGKPAWFGGGPEKRAVAFLSGSGILNRMALPVLRRVRRGIARAGLDSFFQVL